MDFASDHGDGPRRQRPTADDVISLPVTQDVQTDDFVVVDDPKAALDAEEVRKWLAPTDYLAESGEYGRHLSVRAPGTGLWLCNTESYERWYSSPTHSCLWIKGVPGAGKSVIAASLVKHLAEKEDTTPLLFFFFRHIVDANRHQRSLLRDWLAQLLPHSTSLLETLSALKDSSIESVPDHVLWECLYKAMLALPRVICVVDAMDEMNDAGGADFYHRINGLMHLRPGSIKLLLTSRPRQDIQSRLQGPMVVHISLEEDHVNRDIHSFVAHRLRSLMAGEGGEDLARAITSRSAGLFLYARLLVDQISPLIKESLPVDLDKLPLGLGDLYDGMLKQQSQEMGIGQDIQAFLLGCVTHSPRPLRLRELGLLCSNHMRSSMTAAEAKSFVKKACGPLLEVLDDETVQILHHSLTEFLLDPNKRATFPVLEPNSIHKRLALVCISILEEQHGLGESPRHPLVNYALDAWSYHASYDKAMHDEEFLQMLTAFCGRVTRPFISNAPRNRSRDLEWRKTMAWVREDPGSIDGFYGLSMSPLQFASCHGLAHYASTLIHAGDLAAELDLLAHAPHPMKITFRSRVSANGALPSVWWACFGGHQGILKLLMDRASLDETTLSGKLLRVWKPHMLRITLSKRRTAVLGYLLEAGFNPLPLDDNKDFAMQLASLFDVTCTSVALPYLDKPQIDLLLCISASRGDADSVRAILADPRANPNATLLGVTLLYFACMGDTSTESSHRSGSVDCVKQLLDAGADAAAVSSYNGVTDLDFGFIRRSYQTILKRSTALHGLTLFWNNDTHDACKEILLLLLKAGAGIDTKDGEGKTPLASLLSRRHGPRQRLGDTFEAEKPLILLLEQGADACARDKQGRSILRLLLMAFNSPDMVKLLLQHGADACDNEISNSTSEPLLNCLHSSWMRAGPSGAIQSSRSRMHEVAKILAANGASIDADHDGYAITNAMLDGDIDMIKILLSTCQDTRALRTCLLHVLSTSNPRLDTSQWTKEQTAEVFLMLLEAGAPLEERNPNGLTPLLLAAREGDAHMAGLLLKHGAVGVAVDENGDGVLHQLVNWFHHASDYADSSLENLEAFIELGFDPLISNSSEETLLHAYVRAIWKRDFPLTPASERWEVLRRVFSRLLELGISPRRVNNAGLTPLHYIFEELPAEGYEICDLSASTVMLANFIKLCQSTAGGIDIDAKADNGFTALHLAAMSDMEDIAQMVDILLSSGADIASRTSKGLTVLHLACRAHNASVVSLLLARGGISLLEIKEDTKGRTPLFDACESGVPEIVALLLDAGANVKASDFNGRVPLHACADIRGRRSPRLGGCEPFYEGYGTFQEDCNRRMICFKASNMDRWDVKAYSVVLQLLDAGANASVVNNPETGGRRVRHAGFPSPATFAWNRSAYGVMLALSQRGLAPEGAKFAAQWSMMQRPGLGFRRLEAGTEQEILSNPLRYLSLYTIDDMEWLLRKGANLHSILHDGSPERRGYRSYVTMRHVMSFVQHIVHCGQTAFMEPLISVAKQYDLPSNRLSAADAAILTSYTREIELGLELEPCQEPTFQDLVKKCPQTMIRPLVYEACSRVSPNMQMVKLLVEVGGADVNARLISQWSITDNDDQDDDDASDSVAHTEFSEYNDAGADTAVGYMAFRQDYWHLEAIRYLVKQGADINIRDRHGKTPLMMACRPMIRRAVSWTLEFVKLLLDLGADPSLADDSGRTCVHWAQGLDTLDLVLPDEGSLESSSRSLLLKSVEELDPELADMILNKCHVDLNSSYDGRALRWNEPGGMVDPASQYDHLSQSTLPLVGALFVCSDGRSYFRVDGVDERERRKAVVSLLLKHGASPFAVLSNGATLLHSLIRHALLDDDLLAIFLDMEPRLDLGTTDSAGSTLLHEACACDDWDDLDDPSMPGINPPCPPGKVKYETPRAELHLRLIDAGSDVAVVNKMGETAMHAMLTSPGMPSRFILEFLRRPEITARVLDETPSGHTLLHYALYILRPDICTELLSLGANPHLTFSKGDGPLHHIALQCLDRRINHRMLVDNHDPCLESSGPLREAGHTESCLKLWQSFVAAGHDIDAPDEKGRPPLFYYLQWTENQSYSGPSPPPPPQFWDPVYGTPEHRVADAITTEPTKEADNITWFKAFLGNANLQARDLEGRTALHIVALRPRMVGNAEIFKHLMEQGGLDPLVEDSTGRSSLDIAAETGKKDILELFSARKG